MTLSGKHRLVTTLWIPAIVLMSGVGCQCVRRPLPGRAWMEAPSIEVDMEFFELKTGNIGVRIRNTGSGPVALVVVTIVISRFSDKVERWGTIGVGNGKGTDYPLLLVGGKSPPIISTMKQPDAYQSIWVLPKGEANLLFCGMLGQSESFKNFIDGEKKLKVRACAFVVSADIYRGLNINSRAEVWSEEITVEVENDRLRREDEINSRRDQEQD